ncbi:C-5 cytosine-specific DNA methylase [Catenulispora acidiphila DSM 44928]|uniref:DNA (cytosine-5-)-methyltransferase n=1 Tax=Catenulispora acidiphila (strain DSM 44928 / JCM 14897 / NBRC 102108 / NRRL B-24433 / ID139908) TaxID=479433 RepID=C7Q4H7_CATAD|nr:DNA cytosine methyltransferase [Catenulispora acidiphila]ACU71946.1 C-5 cytosine-specific DNA methylase [Catenulispora acidiphila DSM 44928]
MTITFTDIFCGAGGSSTGLVAAGFELKLAANHSKVAISTHAANHGNAEHVCADVNNYDMRRLPTTDVLWASPICTEISPAGGRGRSRKLLPGEEALLEYGPVENAAWERTRATAYDVIRAAEVHRYKVVMCENVMEFATDWELFDWWFSGMERLGYQGQIVSVSAAHIGGDGNEAAPQWRDRIYIVFTLKGIPLPDLKPRPLAWCPECGTDVRAVQAWRNGRKIGKYKQQYDYRCENSSCRHSIVEPYINPAASIIDWDNLGERIGDRTKPLAASTMKRIAAGLVKFPDRRSVITVNHSGHDGRAFPADEGPLPVRSTKIGEGLLIPCGGGWNTTASPTNVPMRTRTANPKGFEALVATSTPFIVEYRNHADASAVTQPLATVTSGGNHHALVVPCRNASTKTTSEPFHTMSTVDSAALVGPAVDINDCWFRMVQPREQLYSQRFPRDYIVHGTKGEQTMQAGNAVACNVAQWVGERVMAVLS